MLVKPVQEASRSAHVVVLGNEKGGSGKSTTALHIAVALLKNSQRVATIDLDSRQRSLTHYIENRRAWSERARVKLDLPTHYCVERAELPFQGWIRREETDCMARHLSRGGLRPLAFAEPPRPFGAWTAARKVCSAKWVIDDYTFDLTSMAHVLGEQLAATECARGGYNRRIPIG